MLTATLQPSWGDCDYHPATYPDAIPPNAVPSHDSFCLTPFCLETMWTPFLHAAGGVCHKTWHAIGLHRSRAHCKVQVVLPHSRVWGIPLLCLKSSAQRTRSTSTARTKESPTLSTHRLTSPPRPSCRPPSTPTDPVTPTSIGAILNRQPPSDHCSLLSCSVSSNTFDGLNMLKQSAAVVASMP